jgi:hypothetical protein
VPERCEGSGCVWRSEWLVLQGCEWLGSALSVLLTSWSAPQSPIAGSRAGAVALLEIDTHAVVECAIYQQRQFASKVNVEEWAVSRL